MEKEQLKKQYLESQPLFTRALLNTNDVLNAFLEKNNISFLTITTRVKDFESFYEKIERKNYNNPFADNEDFCGVRIILYNLSDIEKVNAIIAKEFDILESNNKSEQLNIDQFGYRSYHFIVKFQSQWLGAPNYHGLENIKIEIQIRTILMHAWAEIEHKLGYKNKGQVPPELTRKLFRISAKLEEADEQFQELKNNIESYKNDLLNTAIDKGTFVTEEFNLTTLQTLLDFYFPQHKKDLNWTADLFDTIKIFDIPFDKIVEYAEKIKPFVSYVESLLSSKQKTSQTNIMTYAIEAFHNNPDIYNNASQSRKEIIFKIIERTQRAV